MKLEEAPAPVIIVIFGVTGDLAQRKLFPALLNLFKANLLHDDTIIVGITRQNINTDQLLEDLSKENPIFDADSVNILKSKLQVQTMDVTNPEDYKQLLITLNGIEDKHGLCMNRLYYLSIPPQVFGPIVRFLGENGLNKSCQHNNAKTRLLVEKPFGFDLTSAHELINETSEYFSEDQIFRIDHYLAKETVQNILNFRFSNAIFESIWNSEHISRIDITADEQIGIEGRATFYEQTGALRDLIQSHLIQLLSIVAMNQPEEITSEKIHASRLEILKSVSTIQPDKIKDQALRGQYITYRQEVNNPGSNIETLAAIQVFIDSDRWRDVPIIIKTGKMLDEKRTEIKVIFCRPEFGGVEHNTLTFRIQPNEGIDLGLLVKKPGLDNELERVDMDFSYSKFFDKKIEPDAYERVLVDAIRDDHSLFATSDEVIEAWRIVEPLLVHWEMNGDDLQIYKNNSSGPTDLPEWMSPYYNLNK